LTQLFANGADGESIALVRVNADAARFIANEVKNIGCVVSDEW
jgi:hypothetical protein